MKRCRHPMLGSMAVALAMGVTSLSADEIPRASDSPAPLGPAESQSRFQIADGLRIELVASEPQLREPTGMTFDAAGRIYVSEIHGYNLEGYYDVVELNKTGKLDTAVRRIPASREAQGRAEPETYGTVRLLEDTDGDGRVNRSTVFADRLPPCYGLVPARDGIIALAAPEIIFLADRDGDGRAEVREVLFSGFGVGEIWTRISHPAWGLDNWIYAAAGMSSGGTIRGPHLAEPVKLGNTCFRFKPDGSRIEPVTGGSHGYGLTVDDFGDLFLCTNQQHALMVAPLAYASLARNPFLPGINPHVDISSDGSPAKVFPISQPDPWRTKRGRKPEWVKFYGEKETNSGLVTSACSPVVYRADLLGDRYRGGLFACEPAQNLVHSCRLEPKGAGWTARRDVDNREFLASNDPWFRPVHLTVGPEGALYVVDMYREIIEDYSAIPRYLQQEYVESLRNGFDKGRLWRIVPDAKQIERPKSLAGATTAELVTELSSPNAWRRETAQRLLVDRGDKAAVVGLCALAADQRNPQAQVHALYTLDGLGALTRPLIESALRAQHYGPRLHALRLAERWLGNDAALLGASLECVDDPHAKVRLQLALSLGASADARVIPAQVKLAARDGNDPWMQTAIASAVPDRSAALARALVEAGDPIPGLMQTLARVVGARNDPGEVAALLQLAADHVNDKAARAWQVKLLNAFAQGLGRPSQKPSASSTVELALTRLLSAPEPTLTATIRIAGRMGADDLPKLKSLREEAVTAALDTSRGMEKRRGALSHLAGAPLTMLQAIQPLFDPREPPELQEAAIATLAESDSPDVVPLLVKRWKSYSPRLQSAAIDAIFARQDRLGRLLDAVEQGAFDAGALSPQQKSQLLENGNAKIRERAAKLLAHSSQTDRQAVLTRYAAALSLPRDAERGRTVFQEQCAKCHQLYGQGTQVGPDLAGVLNRPDESLLADVLDPSAAVAAGFRAYTLVTTDGRVLSGTVTAESATSVTLRREKGIDDVILRRDIESLVASSKSLMPEGIETAISPQDIANLLGYLRQIERERAKSQAAEKSR